MATEMSQKVEYHKMGNFLVSNELFLDLIFNDKCNCNCDFCIAKTPAYSIENIDIWKENLFKTFEIFDIRNIIVLGGEATIDPKFFEKLNILEDIIKNKNVDNIILTTNGIMFRSEKFFDNLLKSCITTVNLSCMNNIKEKNDFFMKGNTLSRNEIFTIYNKLKENGRTMRLNTNVFKGNCDNVQDMEKYVYDFSGCCDIIKFSPLMPTNMFGTIKEVENYTNEVSLSKNEIRNLYDNFSKDCKLITSNNVFGLVDYKELEIFNQRVILKYAQVEDTYDLDKVIPTLKLYNNGNLSNEWDYNKNILPKLEYLLD